MPGRSCPPYSAGHDIPSQPRPAILRIEPRLAGDSAFSSSENSKSTRPLLDRSRESTLSESFPGGESVWIALLALLWVALGCGETTKLRNVLLVTVDTLRADHVGPYGSELPTPAFDTLAREGVVIEGACTPTPSTGPAHVSLMTGLHPWRHGVLLNAVAMHDQEVPVLAEHLHDAGFATAGFVSSFNLDRRYGFARGFDSYGFEGTFQHSDKPDFWNVGGETTERALAWLDQRGPEPFFLWVHYFDPHAPYDPPPDFYRPKTEPIDIAGKTLPPGFPSRKMLIEAVRGYRGSVVYSDAQIGALIDRLRDTEQLDETLVVVTSDHGEGLGDHGRLGHGHQLYDELVTIPLLLRGARLPAGVRLKGAAQLEDLMPTILSLVGAPIPPGLDGLDLSPWLRGEVGRSPRRAVVGRIAAFPNEPVLYFSRSWPEKWIGGLEGEGTAFRLDADARERRGRKATVLPESLRAVASGEWQAKERVIDAESREALEALGYLEPEAEERAE